MGDEKNFLTPVFIGGCDRSGTTFLAASLARFPGVIALPESHFIAEAAVKAHDPNYAVTQMLKDFGAHPRYSAWREVGCAEPLNIASGALSHRTAIDRLIRDYSEKCGFGPPSAFIEHAPPNIHNAQALRKLFPDLKLFHIYRDGRAVSASWMPLDWGPNEITEMAQIWPQRVSAGCAAVEALGAQHAMNVRYENVVANSGNVLRKLAKFIGTTKDAGPEGHSKFRQPSYSKKTHQLVGGKADKTRLDAWRQKLSPREIEIFEALAGPTLDELGYLRSHDGVALMPAPHEKLYYALIRKICYLRNRSRYNKRHRS
jgi:sulfotransferase family protein